MRYTVTNVMCPPEKLDDFEELADGRTGVEYTYSN